MNPIILHTTRLLAGLLVLASGTARTSPTASTQIVRGMDAFELTYRATLPELKETARLWVPLARSDAFQTVKVKRLSTPVGWEVVEDRANGNLILAMSPGPDASGQPIEITYEVRRSEKKAYEANEPDFARHLRPERLVPAHQTFTDLARQAAEGRVSDMDKGRALYEHTLERMRYDKSGEGWGRGDALYACDARTGNCTDFHAYFIALCRASGIPARFAIGFTIPADRQEGDISGYHCWAEFYTNGHWVPVDISEADRHPELADYYFGHHPANRFELSTGRDLNLSPGPSSGPINFLVYPLLEVNGKEVKTENQFQFKRAKP